MHDRPACAVVRLLAEAGHGMHSMHQVRCTGFSLFAIPKQINKRVFFKTVLTSILKTCLLWPLLRVTTESSP
jgi:hypothetical protein